MLIQPRRKRVIDVPTSCQTVMRRVLVGEAESGWKRVKFRRYCG